MFSTFVVEAITVTKRFSSYVSSAYLIAHYTRSTALGLVEQCSLLQLEMGEREVCPLLVKILSALFAAKEDPLVTIAVRDCFLVLKF